MDTVEYPLQNGGVTLIDAGDLEVVAQHRWQSMTTPQGREYAGHSTKVKGSVHTVMLHRMLMDAPKGLDVDHINGDGLDNRRANLRLLTHSENLHNRKGVNKNNSTGYRGVSLHKPTGRFHATICVNGKTYSGKYHDTPEEAARAVDDLLLEHVGPAATLNFPSTA